MGDDDECEQKLQAPPDFDGPTRHRHCTDVLCLGLIILMWVLMTALGSYAVSHGGTRQSIQIRARDQSKFPVSI